MPIAMHTLLTARKPCAWLFFSIIQPPSRSPLFPYSTLIRSVAATISACSEYVVSFVYAHCNAHTTYCKETVCVVAPYRLRNSMLAAAARILPRHSMCCGNDFGLQ